MAEDRIPLGLDLSRSLSDRGRTTEETLFDEPASRASGESTEQVRQASGRLNRWEAMFVVAGLCSGITMLTVDALVVNMGIGGILMLCLILPASTYTALLEGRCWDMVRHRWQHDRHPYGAIGYEAFGTIGRFAIDVLVVGTGFCYGITSLVITAEMIFLVSEETFRGLFCYFPVIIACFTLPFTWFGTPKDIWQIGALGVLSTVLATILLLIGMAVAEFDEPASRNATEGTTSPSTVVPQMSYPLRLMEICGVTLFALGGHYMFPTVQQDMVEPHLYAQVTLTAYGCLISLMALVIIASYIFLPLDLFVGMTSSTNAINLLPRSLLTIVPTLLFFVHQCTVTVTCNNPLFQYVEELLDITQAFSWRRVLSRSTLVLLELFVAESIPQFGILATLIGGVCTPTLMLIAPCLCYLRLRSIHAPDEFLKSKGIWVLETAVCWLVTVFTPVLMIAILYIVGSSMASGKTVFTVPCYVNATLAHD